ncbi:MAG: tRNA (N(6)-L-threonylcarbamoyladenosine(37)-C(2))-methylthiotransferase MtaB [Clostridiales bacterium]|nr:tRNA (N(6)-L-threonylcarbamoyladenosine(37)-C(2))-methylthiotransferase MtaB [Clostridiales bacterium]
MKAVVFSLGCKVNAYEGQAIINLLERMGYEVSDKPEAADVYILNTCSVTAEADKKSRQAVERLKKFNRDAKILVLGCSSQNSPERYLCNDTVTAVSGVGGKIEAVKRFIDEISKKAERFYGTGLPGIYEDNLSPAATKTRGYIKIQDGCDNFCSYCRIPYLRGRSRSRKVDSIVREAQEVATHSKEIILTGINVSDYYSSGSGLTELVYALKDIPARKRLSSLECEVVDERLLVALKECGFCDHFHLSLQSGSDAVLKRMNRHYTVEEYLEKVELIYKHFPEAAITTDMIAGFPTETEEDHIIGMETARKAKFAAIHVFPYSEREGTTAAKLPQLEKAIRSHRAAQLIKLGTELKNNFIKKNIGRVAEVYAETEENGISEGFTTNYIKIYSPLKAGEMGKVKLVEPYLDGIKGELV